MDDHGLTRITGFARDRHEQSDLALGRDIFHRETEGIRLVVSGVVIAPAARTFWWFRLSSCVLLRRGCCRTEQRRRHTSANSAFIPLPGATASVVTSSDEGSNTWLSFSRTWITNHPSIPGELIPSPFFQFVIFLQALPPPPSKSARDWLGSEACFPRAGRPFFYPR